MLEDVRESYELKASSIHSWRTISKEDLANLYFAYENDKTLKEIYFSCIVLKFWGMIGRMYISCKNMNVPIETCYDWLIDSLMYVLEKRVWKNPENKYYNHPSAFNMMVTKRLITIKQQYVRLMNTQSHSEELKLLYIEDLKDIVMKTSKSPEDNQKEVTLEQLSYNEYEDVKGDMLCKDIVQHYLDNKKELNAVIINTICFSDVMYKADKKLIVDSDTLREQVLKLSNKDKLTQEYKVDKVRLNKVYERLQSASKRRLTKYIRDTLQELRTNAFVLNLVN